MAASCRRWARWFSWLPRLTRRSGRDAIGDCERGTKYLIITDASILLGDYYSYGVVFNMHGSGVQPTSKLAGESSPDPYQPSPVKPSHLLCF